MCGCGTTKTEEWRTDDTQTPSECAHARAAVWGAGVRNVGGTDYRTEAREYLRAKGRDHMIDTVIPKTAAEAAQEKLSTADQVAALTESMAAVQASCMCCFYTPVGGRRRVYSGAAGENCAISVQAELATLRGNVTLLRAAAYFPDTSSSSSSPFSSSTETTAAALRRGTKRSRARRRLRR